MPLSYLERVHSKPLNVEHYHDLSVVPKFAEAKKIIEEMKETLKDARYSQNRTELVATRLLTDYYFEYLEFIADAFTLRAQKKDQEALDFTQAFFREFGKKEVAIERYYDQHIYGMSWNAILKAGIQVEQ